MTTRCIRCGKEIQGTAQFCDECAAIQAEATSFQQPSQPQQTWGTTPQQAAPTVSAPTKCPSCGADLPTDATFCGVCGTQISRAAPTSCTNCGAALAPGTAFCANCGTHVSATAGVEYAGFWARFLAVIIDGLILLVVAALPAGIIGLLTESVALFYVIDVLISIAYYSWGNGSGGTWGKQVMGLRVISPDQGGDIGPAAGLGRTIVWWLGTIPFYLGWFWMLWDREKRCWHDHAAGSIVVKARP